MDTRSIKYELSQRSRGVVYGGVALLHRLANDVGLVKAINNKVNLLKLWLPYSEADHVLNFAFNGLCEGTCLEDIELRRNDEAFLDALGPAGRLYGIVHDGDWHHIGTPAGLTEAEDILSTDPMRSGGKR